MPGELFRNWNFLLLKSYDYVGQRLLLVCNPCVVMVDQFGILRIVSDLFPEFFCEWTEGEKNLPRHLIESRGAGRFKLDILEIISNKHIFEVVAMFL